MFSPSGFAEQTETFQNSRDLIASISSFCRTYGIDPSRCAEELFTFAPSFPKFNRSFFDFPKERKEYFHDLGDSDSEEECYDDNDHDDSDSSDDDEKQPDEAS